MEETLSMSQKDFVKLQEINKKLQHELQEVQNSIVQLSKSVIIH